VTIGPVLPADCRQPDGSGAARELCGGEAHLWPPTAWPATVHDPLATRARTHGGGRGTGKPKGAHAHPWLFTARAHPRLFMHPRLFTPLGRQKQGRRAVPIPAGEVTVSGGDEAVEQPGLRAH
jgi:hypothetical protein